MSDVEGYFHVSGFIARRDGESLFDRRQLTCGKLNVNDGAGDLYYSARIHMSEFSFARLAFWAFSPAAISVISCVIADCLTLL